MDGRLTFLGTGTSMGVPTVGCGCAVCTSTDPRDRRLRPSVLVRWNDPTLKPLSDPPFPREEAEWMGFGAHVGHPVMERVVVIDTGPDFREQALRNRLKRVDAVFYKHSHADHIFGLDDLRPLSFVAAREGGPIPLYASPETTAVLEHIYEYTFSPEATYPMRARVQLEPLAPRTEVHGVEFIRVPVMHGEMEIAGFRFGNAAYLTDVSSIPEESFALLEGLEVLVVSALRHKPHPSHATVDQAVGWARRIGARQTFFTHIAHELGHEATNRSLPAGMALAYDGLELAVSL
jgi:phosphoribosyl 1,2-cyclic phosphate phosphodiesterase